MGSTRGPWTTRSAGSSPAVDGRRFGFRRRRRHRREAPGHFHLWNSLCAVNPSAFQEGSAYILGGKQSRDEHTGSRQGPSGRHPQTRVFTKRPSAERGGSRGPLDTPGESARTSVSTGSGWKRGISGGHWPRPPSEGHSGVGGLVL